MIAFLSRVTGGLSLPLFTFTATFGGPAFNDVPLRPKNKNIHLSQEDKFSYHFFSQGFVVVAYFELCPCSSSPFW